MKYSNVLNYLRKMSIHFLFGLTLKYIFHFLYKISSQVKFFLTSIQKYLKSLVRILFDNNQLNYEFDEICGKHKKYEIILKCHKIIIFIKPMVEDST